MKMNIKNKSRKGALTQQQLIMYAILILGFIVLLYFIFVLDLGAVTDKEICRNSVILRDKTEGVGGELNCKTNYLCISGGEDCKDITPTQTVKIDASESAETIKKEIMKALAEEMSDCWWQFGEGKLDYVGVESFKKVACSVCSIVDFDEKLQGTSPISYQEFYDYLRTTPKTKTQTYLQYLYSTNTLNVFSEGFNPKENYLGHTLEFDKEYFILTGETKEGVLTPRWNVFETKFTPQPVVILEKTNANYGAVGCDEYLQKP